MNLGFIFLLANLTASNVSYIQYRVLSGRLYDLCHDLAVTLLSYPINYFALLGALLIDLHYMMVVPQKCN